MLKIDANFIFRKTQKHKIMIYAQDRIFKHLDSLCLFSLFTKKKETEKNTFPKSIVPATASEESFSSAS